jgi:CubicO group peptidase (beta-lactamase class C family)
VNRRQWLGGAGAALLATRLPAAAGDALPAAFAIRSPGTADYRAALDAIGSHVQAELEATGLPGMSLAVAAADGFAATLSFGWADLGSRTAVGPDQLFPIGSISKSLVALWLAAAADKGRVALDAPLSRYLPAAALPAEPITLAQALDHLGGLPDDAPLFPSVPGDRLWTGLPPGTRFSYSNVGYDLLGLVMAAVGGHPHPQLLADDVLAPLGMVGALPHLLAADRARFETGYLPAEADRLALTHPVWREAPWIEEDRASGSVAASAGAMIGFLGYVMALGQGKGGVLMGDPAAVRLLANPVPAPDFGARARYARGFATQTIEGRRLLHHTGGTLSCASSFHVDAAAGVGCFAAVNARLNDYRPQRATSYAVAALRAARAGRPPPARPDPAVFNRVRDPRRFAGRWLSAAGDALELDAAAGGLSLTADGARGRVEAADDHLLVTDHPRRSAHLLDFEGGRGAATRLWWGGTPFARGRAPAAPNVPDRLRRLEGHYAAAAPGAPTLDLFARGDRLWAEPLGEMVERTGGWWSAPEDAGGIDRLWFEAPIAGRPSRLCYNGYIARRID